MPVFEVVMEPPGSPTFEDANGNERPVRRSMTVGAADEAEAKRLALKQCVDMTDPALATGGVDEEMFEIVSIEEHPADAPADE